MPFQGLCQGPGLPLILLAKRECLVKMKDRMTRRWIIALGAALAAFVLVVFLPGLLGPGPTGATGGDVSSTLSEGGLGAYALIFFGGVLTSLTPCVYPLIPITVSIFGAKNAKSRLAGFGLSVAYVCGMVVMYAALGVVAAMTGKAFGQWLGSPIVVGVIALVLAGFALSMFGLYEVRLPSGLHTKLASVRGVGPVSSFTMGLLAGVIAAPCTGPVLSGVLAIVASVRDPVVGFAMLATYALGIGVLFLALGTFSLSLPKSGAWMETVKAVFGTALLAAALWFVKPVFPALKGFVLPAMVAGGMVALGAGLIVVHQSLHEKRRVHLTAKVLGVLFALIGLGARFGADDGPRAANLEFPWSFDAQVALATARSEGRPMMIDFWAEWCDGCKELDKHTYVDPRVQEEAKRFISLKVDLTDPTDALDALQKEFGVMALPTVVFLDSGGAILERPRITGFVKAPEMLESMRKVQ